MINTASVVAYDPPAILLDYSTTKAGIVAFSKALAKQVIENGIHVNAVAPSPDTRGSTSTSTAEGPSYPRTPIPDEKASSSRRDGEGKREVPPPGERVDDEATDSKVTRRQE